MAEEAFAYADTAARHANGDRKAAERAKCVKAAAALALWKPRAALETLRNVGEDAARALVIAGGALYDQCEVGVVEWGLSNPSVLQFEHSLKTFHRGSRLPCSSGLRRVLRSGIQCSILAIRASLTHLEANARILHANKTLISIVTG